MPSNYLFEDNEYYPLSYAFPLTLSALEHLWAKIMSICQQHTYLHYQPLFRINYQQNIVRKSAVYFPNLQLQVVIVNTISLKAIDTEYSSSILYSLFFKLIDIHFSFLSTFFSTYCLFGCKFINYSPGAVYFLFAP